MLARIKARLHTPFGRYLVVGVSVYVFELVVIFVAQRAGGSAIVSVSLSFWSGLLLSFFLQKLVAFGDKRMHRHVLVPQIIAVSLLVLFNYGFTLLLTKLLQHIWPLVVIRTLALIITTIWNYYLYKTRIFKTDEPVID